MGAGVLLTKRLTLRPIAKSDAEFFTKALSDRRVWRWLSVVPHPYTIDDAMSFIEKVRGPLTIIWSGDPVGVIDGMGELGYWLAFDAWGHGLMLEAATAVLDARFLTSEQQQVFSGHFDGNIASRRVLQKLGFRDIGSTTLPCLADGRTDVPSRRMLLTREDWFSRSAQPTCEDLKQ